MSAGRPVMAITGASRGIGAATARLAAESGFDVAIGYRSSAEAAGAVADDCRAAGADAATIEVDIAVESSIVDFFKTIESRFGRLDGFVNNAGIAARLAPLVEIDSGRIEELFRVNAIGPIIAAREAVRRMSTASGGDGGTIVNVSSAASYLGSPNEFVDYAATKGAIDSFTIGLAKEVVTQGIRVNAVRPGLIHTDIHDSSGVEDRVDRLAGNIPMQRGGDPAEVASAIVWLSTEASSYVTGAILNVSGGR